MTLRLTRRQYADLYGPTTGDRVRLADTELFIRIERDLTTPGEEAKFGGGKVIRDGMGQSQRQIGWSCHTASACPFCGPVGGPPSRLRSQAKPAISIARFP